MLHGEQSKNYGETYTELAISSDPTSFQDQLISVEGYGAKRHVLPVAVAVDMAIEVTISCFDFLEDEPNPHLTVIDDPITAKRRQVRNVLLALMDAQHIPEPEIAQALDYAYETEKEQIRFSGEIAKAWDVVTDKRPTNIFNTKFEVANGRFKREVERWVYAQNIKSEQALFALIREGDEQALEAVVNRNTDAILLEVARLFGTHASDETVEEAVRFVRDQAKEAIEPQTPTEFDERCIAALELHLTVFEEERAKAAIEHQKQEAMPHEMEALGTNTYRQRLKELLASEGFNCDEVDYDQKLVNQVIHDAISYITDRLKGAIPPPVKHSPRHTKPKNVKAFEAAYTRRFRSVIRERAIASIALQQASEISFDLIDLAQDRPDTFLRFLSGLADELSYTEFNRQ